MNTSIKELEDQIRNLPLSDMVALHESLIITIQEREEKESYDPAYKAELERRFKEIKSGGVEGIDAYKALEEL